MGSRSITLLAVLLFSPCLPAQRPEPDNLLSLSITVIDCYQSGPLTVEVTLSNLSNDPIVLAYSADRLLKWTINGTTASFHAAFGQWPVPHGYFLPDPMPPRVLEGRQSWTARQYLRDSFPIVFSRQVDFTLESSGNTGSVQSGKLRPFSLRQSVTARARPFSDESARILFRDVLEDVRKANSTAAAPRGVHRTAPRVTEQPWDRRDRQPPPP